MDITKVLWELETYMCREKRIRMALIDVDTAVYQMIDYEDKNKIQEGNFRNYVIEAAQHLPQKARKDFVLNMAPRNIKSKLDPVSGAYDLEYRLEDISGVGRYENVTFWQYEKNLLGVIFSDVTKTAKKQEIVSYLDAGFKEKMMVLAKSLTTFFCEIDMETHSCTVWNKKSWFKEFPVYEEQIEWILDNFILPEEKAQYRKELALEDIVRKAENEGYELVCRGIRKFSNYTLKLVFILGKDDNRGRDRLYIYAEDVSALKVQEDKNRQLLEISQQLLNLSQNDGLTGLYNKSAAEREIKKYIQENAENVSGALILIDIDYFKFFTDNYGHQVGDEVLKHVALSIRNAFRDKDILCRWGGDEFMIMMKGHTAEKMIHSRIERLRMFTRTLKEGETPLKVTLSVGAAALEKGESFNRLFRRADELLYQVKKNGRDNFIIDVGEQHLLINAN